MTGSQVSSLLTVSGVLRLVGVLCAVDIVVVLYALLDDFHSLLLTHYFVDCGLLALKLLVH